MAKAKVRPKKDIRIVKRTESFMTIYMSRKRICQALKIPENYKLNEIELDFDFDSVGKPVACIELKKMTKAEIVRARRNDDEEEGDIEEGVGR